MGLFKKFFSIGSRKSKKRSAVDPHTPSTHEHLKPSQVDDTEAAVNRLLRSSSGRFETESQAGISSLPPLPHPIDNDTVISLPKSSSTSVASVSARSTYSVTIHGRTVHSRTEFPNAYPPMDPTFTPKRSLADPARQRSKSVPITPRDNSRLLLLRQDPSVASLLRHYDDEGHLNATLFSNTPSPQKEGYVQRHRTGSTLRQLLGHPCSPGLRNTSMEGDISWAEKFLGEIDDNSSQSSLGPQTPVDTHFALVHSIDDRAALPIECDTSAANQLTFSSLEVELSASADLAQSYTSNPSQGSSTTPQRASQIFGFLGDKKKVYHSPASRLPQLKATVPTGNYRRFSVESFASDNKQFYCPAPRPSHIYIPQPTSPTTQRRCSFSSDVSRSPPSSPITTAFLSPRPEDEEAAFSQTIISQHTGQSSRGPRGPRPPSRIPSRQNGGASPVLCALDDSHPATERHPCIGPVSDKKSNTDIKYAAGIYARPREMHSQIPRLRSGSGSSSISAESRHEPTTQSPCQHPPSLQPGVVLRPGSTEIEVPAGLVFHSKENDVQSRLPQLITPVRRLSHHLYDLASPASSSELSPIAKHMMANLRQQRIHARQREREAGRLGSSQSRIRY